MDLACDQLRPRLVELVAAHADRQDRSVLETLLEAAQTIVLPIAVAIITAQVTLRASRIQIASSARQDAERREHEGELRLRDVEAGALRVRGEVLEQISDAIDEYKRHPDHGTDAVLRAFFRLSSRCAAQHLADNCRRYITVAAAESDPSWVGAAMDDALRRLVGWHLGHLDLWQVDDFVVAATREIEHHIKRTHPERWRSLFDAYAAAPDSGSASATS